LREFAKTKGINTKEVDEFLNQYNTPKTLSDVIDLPYDMQHHETYITWLSDPLKSFISDEMYDGQRYETIKVDSVVDCLYDRIYDLIDDNDIDIDEVGIENLVTEDINKMEKLNELKAVAQHIIDIKFGSVVMDW
jgi:hypothetical protein